MVSLINDLKKALPEGSYEEVTPFKDRENKVVVKIKPGKLRDVVKALVEAGFNHFLCIEAIDWWKKDNTFEMVYMLSSPERGGPIVMLRFKIPRDNPVVDTISDMVPLAYYQEIENYEFFGIEFKGHGGLRKWILQDNWEGPPPLRKDFDARAWVLEVYYGGKRYERPVKEGEESGE